MRSHSRFFAAASTFVAVIGVTLAWAMPSLAAIDDGFNVEVSPLPIILNIPPGGTTSTQLRVRNAGVSDEQLQIHVLKVTEDNNGNVHLTQPGPADTFVNWVHFSQTTFDAQPNVWDTIQMTVSPPKSAAFGYYFAVEYSRATPNLPQGGQTATNGAVATFVLLNVVAPGEARQASIASFSTDHEIYNYLPTDFSVKVHAAGNVQVVPHGDIFIKQGSKTIATLPVNNVGGNVLPNSSRIFTTEWNNGFPHYVDSLVNGQPVVGSNGQPKRHLVWNWNNLGNLRFGHYTASLLMVYDNGTRDVPLQATLGFWVIPWELILVLVVVIALVALGLISSLRGSWRAVRQRTRRRQ